MNHSYIAVDWGSTNLRAWLYRDGKCVDSQQSTAGVTRLEGRTPVQVFQQLIAPWQQQGLPVLMAGMVGSDAGWVPAPYLRCPISLSEIPHRLTPVEQATSANVRIIPGICIESEDNLNVMRGEETQLVGAYATRPAEFYLLPGTHSKWVRLEGDSVVDFSTVMTGELHHLLLTHSLIGSGLPEQTADSAAFAKGMEQGFYDSSLMRRLFEVRAARVLGKLAKTSVSDWLSGLLIGHEVAQIQQHYSLSREHGPLVLVGSPALTQRYLPALKMAGIQALVIEGDTAFQAGIRSIVNELEN